MEITKEELIELIKNTVNEMNVKKEINEGIRDIKRDIQDEVVENSCDKKQEEIVEVKNEETVPETKEEKKEEEVKVEDKDEPKEEKEVIKIESLNSAHTPSMTQEPEWKKLHGKAFFDWYKSHQNCI